MIYLFITFILDIIISYITKTSYQNLNYLFPVLLISTYPVIYNLIKNKKIMFFITIIIGVIYDTLYSEIFLINTYYLILYYLFLYIYYKNNKKTYLNIITISLIGLIIYELYIPIILILLNYSIVKIEDIYYKIIHTIPLNLIYIITSIIILKSRIFTIKKRRKKVKKKKYYHNIF